MTMQEFDLLLDIEKEETILDNGTFVSTHLFNDEIFDTYQLGSFYVQFNYALEGSNNTRIICFPDSAMLFPIGNQQN
jgi:hypothetical protein